MTDITKTEAALWNLLDDISTAGDMFKPDDTPFVKYVLKKCEERGKYLGSLDGYTLVRTEGQEEALAELTKTAQEDGEYD